MYIIGAVLDGRHFLILWVWVHDWAGEADGARKRGRRARKYLVVWCVFSRHTDGLKTF